MAKIKVKLEEWLKYLEDRVNIDLYVWGANDELIVNLLDKLCNMEEKKENIDRILTLLQKRLLEGCDILKIRCDDCSGLAIGFLLKMGILKSDKTADGLYNLIKEKIKVQEVIAGDYLFMGTDDKKTHVGYAINDKWAIESKNRDVGVVKTKISERGWEYAARPDWYEGAEPKKPVLKRDLYYTNPMMRGDDVQDAQELLNKKGYDCGEADGIFGRKTENATKNFQTDCDLKADGIIGKRTAEALGFKWEGE